MPDNGLTLRKRREFDLLFRTGFRIQGELVRLLFLKSAGSVPRVGFVVGKRQGKAHIRNRGRRVLREAFRRLRPWVVSDTLFVVSLKDKALEAKATRIYYDMARVLKKHGLLKPEWTGAEWK